MDQGFMKVDPSIFSLRLSLKIRAQRRPLSYKRQPVITFGALTRLKATFNMGTSTSPIERQTSGRSDTEHI